MKNTLTALTLLLIGTVSANAQKLYDILPLKDDRVTYIQIEKAEGLTKDQIYRRARRWFVENYRTSNNVLQLQDIESGELAGKGISSAGIPFRRAIMVDCKDGRYRITLTEFTINPAGAELPIESDKYSRYYSKSNFIDYLKLIHEDNLATIESIRTTITRKQEDW